MRGFYAPGHSSDQMPLSRRLAGLLKAASKVGAPVEGVDFDWVSNAQDAEQGWQKSARFSMLKSKPGQSAVRVLFRNNQRDNELVSEPRTIRHPETSRRALTWISARIGLLY